MILHGGSDENMKKTSTYAIILCLLSNTRYFIIRRCLLDLFETSCTIDNGFKENPKRIEQIKERINI